MGAKVLFVGLDAAEATVIDALADEGVMPVVASLRARGWTGRLGNCMDTLPGAIWPEISTGVSAWRRGIFYHPLQVRTGEGTLRPLEAEDEDPDQYFWVRAARAGRRVASIDPPQSDVAAGVSGLQVVEWATHDRNYRPRSEPPEFLDGLRERFGPHPIWNCNEQAGRGDDTRRTFLGALAASVGQKTEFTAELLAEDWDLFACTFGESHCVGHHYWSYFDRRTEEHDPGAPEDLRRAVRDVYALLDRSVGTLVDRAGPDATVVLLASHGMGPYVGGPDLLYPFLHRMGLTGGVPPGRRPVTGWRRLVPTRVKRAGRRLLAPSRPDRVVTRPRPIAPGARAFVVPNNRVGALRLNLAGREPHGTIAPGAEADALVEEISRELLALRRPGTDDPVVAEVVRAEEAWPGERHPDTPDLLVRFRQDVGRLWAAESERLGLLELSPPKRFLRTGDHSVESRMWVAGPGIPAGANLDGADVLDVAPTVLRLLDVELPAGFDGRPLFSAAGAPVTPAPQH